MLSCYLNARYGSIIFKFMFKLRNILKVDDIEDTLSGHQFFSKKREVTTSCIDGTTHQFFRTAEDGSYGSFSPYQEVLSLNHRLISFDIYCQAKASKESNLQGTTRDILTLQYLSSP